MPDRVDAIISEELLCLGLTPNLTGFRYAEFIIKKIVDSGNKPLSMSALLLSCSINCESSVSRVDRNLRTMVDIVKTNGRSGYFSPVEKINSSSFVFVIAERVRNRKIKELEKCTTMEHSA